ncbi:hypothetical protein BSMD_041290 [Bacillus subtilis Miyagi-4]|nr:hypothetical protein BSMD_041290 [Bacillus subtilis Miyagi-4]
MQIENAGYRPPADTELSWFLQIFFGYTRLLKSQSAPETYIV